MHNKYITVFILFILGVTEIFSQQDSVKTNTQSGYHYNPNNTENRQTKVVKKQKPHFNPYWSFGGNLGLSFWNGGTDILIAPKVYYNFTPQFMAGAGIIYNYSDYSSSFYDYKYNSFGGSILGAFRPVRYLQLSAELQTVKTNRDRNDIKDDYWNESLFLGASFVSGPVAVGIQFDALYDQGKSPYSSAWTPFISFYF